MSIGDGRVCFEQRFDELGRCTEKRDPDVVDQAKESSQAGMSWIAVIHNNRGFAGHHGGEPVPHHPAGGGEVEHSVLGPNVARELVFFHVRKQHTAGSMHDGFWFPGGAR